MTNHSPSKETGVPADNYYTNAKHWQQEIYHSLSLRLRWSMCLNGCCLTLLVLSLTSLCLLLPLKQTVPFVFSHHPKTGELTQLGELQPANFSGDWTLIRYFLMRYVSLR